MGLDYGGRRIGVALSDDDQHMAVGVDVVENVDSSHTLHFLKLLCEREKVKKIVVGLPITMAGEKGQQAVEAERFGIMLEDQLKIPVEFYDERLSSAEIEKALFARKQPKNVVDREAARLILQGYLDARPKAI